MAVHVFAMTDDQIETVSRIWQIDFVHKWHDHRSHGDIDWDNDTLIFANSSSDDRVSEWTWQDHELNQREVRLCLIMLGIQLRGLRL